MTHPLTHPGRQPVGARSAALAILTAALWGGTPVAVRFSVDALPPLAVAAVRFGLAALFMIVWCAVQRTPLWPRRGQWPVVLGAGVFLYVQIALFTIGVAQTSSSHGSLLINSFVF